MRKIQNPIQSSSLHPPSSRAPMVILFVMIMMVSPFIYEGGSIIFAQWQSMYGTHWEAKTPILDATRQLYRDLNRDVSRRTNYTLLAGNWNPSLAIPLAVFWAGVGVFFLRRGK